MERDKRSNPSPLRGLSPANCNHEPISWKLEGGLTAPLANALGVAEDGIDPASYQLARIGEKRRRLQGQLSLEDKIETYLDIMGHAAVAIACLQRDSK